jgi:hypothetical protein
MENLVTLEGLLNRITDDLDAQPSQVYTSAGILEQSMTARNRVGIGLS